MNHVKIICCNCDEENTIDNENTANVQFNSVLDEDTAIKMDAIECTKCCHFLPKLQIDLMKQQSLQFHIHCKQFTTILQLWSARKHGKTIPNDIISCIFKYWLQILYNKQIYSVINTNFTSIEPCFIQKIHYTNNKLLTLIKRSRINDTFWIDLLDTSGQMYTEENDKDKPLKLHKYGQYNCFLSMIYGSKRIVFVKTLTGKTVTLYPNPNKDTILDLKKQLCKQERMYKLGPENIRFATRSKLYDDDYALCSKYYFCNHMNSYFAKYAYEHDYHDYSDPLGSTIHAILRLRSKSD
eukprot:16123_1